MGFRTLCARASRCRRTGRGGVITPRWLDLERPAALFPCRLPPATPQKLETDLKSSYSAKNFTLKYGLLQIEKRWRSFILETQDVAQLWGEVTALLVDDHPHSQHTQRSRSPSQSGDRQTNSSSNSGGDRQTPHGVNGITDAAYSEPPTPADAAQPGAAQALSPSQLRVAERVEVFREKIRRMTEDSTRNATSSSVKTPGSLWAGTPSDAAAAGGLTPGGLDGGATTPGERGGLPASPEVSTTSSQHVSDMARHYEQAIHQRRTDDLHSFMIGQECRLPALRAQLGEDASRFAAHRGALAQELRRLRELQAAAAAAGADAAAREAYQQQLCSVRARVLEMQELVDRYSEASGGQFDRFFAPDTPERVRSRRGSGSELRAWEKTLQLLTHAVGAGEAGLGAAVSMSSHLIDDFGTEEWEALDQAVESMCEEWGLLSSAAEAAVASEEQAAADRAAAAAATAAAAAAAASTPQGVADAVTPLPHHPGVHGPYSPTRGPAPPSPLRHTVLRDDSTTATSPFRAPTDDDAPSAAVSADGNGDGAAAAAAADPAAGSAASPVPRLRSPARLVVPTGRATGDPATSGPLPPLSVRSTSSSVPVSLSTVITLFTHFMAVQAQRQQQQQQQAAAAAAAEAAPAAGAAAAPQPQPDASKDASWPPGSNGGAASSAPSFDDTSVAQMADQFRKYVQVHLNLKVNGGGDCVDGKPSGGLLEDDEIWFDAIEGDWILPVQRSVGVSADLGRSRSTRSSECSGGGVAAEAGASGGDLFAGIKQSMVDLRLRHDGLLQGNPEAQAMWADVVQTLAAHRRTWREQQQQQQATPCVTGDDDAASAPAAAAAAAAGKSPPQSVGATPSKPALALVGAHPTSSAAASTGTQVTKSSSPGTPPPAASMMSPAKRPVPPLGSGAGAASSPSRAPPPLPNVGSPGGVRLVINAADEARVSAYEAMMHDMNVEMKRSTARSLELQVSARAHALSRLTSWCFRAA